MTKLSIIIPVYNEVNCLEQLIGQVEEADFCGCEKEIILVDDYSTDGSRDILKNYENKYLVLYHEKNKGKGAAIRTAVEKASGDIIVIQDADLEYSPKDYNNLLPLILDDKADVVYGSRFLNMENNKNFMLKNLIGNKALTIMFNVLFGSKITDMETCYKAFKKDFLKSVTIKSDRFDFEPEITAKMLKKKARLIEVPISYEGRGHSEGKKIGWRDGIQAIKTIIKFRFTD
ncbi:glycosyltransferase family 2 protein [bacterium]|nr:glycosyltransferase family 2 protein [bacterium]